MSNKYNWIHHNCAHQSLFSCLKAEFGSHCAEFTQVVWVLSASPGAENEFAQTKKKNIKTNKIILAVAWSEIVSESSNDEKKFS